MLPALAFLLLPPPAEPWKDFLTRIESVSVSEPPVLAVDTRIRAAQVLAPKHPAEARRLLDDAVSLTYTFTDPRTRALLFTDIYEALRPFDIRAADDLAAAIPSSAYTAGALSNHLQDTVRRNPEAAPVEYSALLDAFPANPGPEDVRQLLQFTRHLGPLSPDLTKVGLAKARAALKDRRFQADPETRRLLELELAGKTSQDPKPPRPDEPAPPSVEGLSDTEIVALARRQPPLVAAQMLLDLLDDDKPLPAMPRRLAIAREALELSEKLPPSEDRLVCQSMLARRLYHYGDPVRAAAAARMLEETFTKLYECDSAACTSIRLAGNPGQPVADFAEYLLENGIRPADLGLSHPSLDARVLILDLGTLLNGKRKSLFSVGR